MKKLFSKVVIWILCAVSLAALPSCSKAGSTRTPQDVIKEAYGDTEYKISFSSEGLDAPLEDLTYTAKSIPVLPVPQKVGYVFGGWFFDKEYHTQYQDNLLLMTMGDVTLYAKWLKEDLAVSGTYDIDFEAEILEDTVKEGKNAAEFGGYKKFPENISAENTYIEKSDNDLLLKIEYDCMDPEPYGALADSYKITVNALKNPSSVYIKESVNSLSDTVKTIYIRITVLDLSVPIYLDVETTNWNAEGLSDEERYGTTTTYTVAFRITRLIGFKTPYVDTSVPLEDGYYLVRSYFKAIENKSSMGDGFNSVFSYLKAENGKYKLIKPFTPYAGLVQFTLGKLEEPYYQNLFYRMMSFMPNQYCFELDTTGFDGEVESNYYPETYKAKKYVDNSVEFHTDDYKIYSIIDLGTNFKREFGILYSVSGFMEVAGGMGSGLQILYMDYDHIIRLSDENVDYRELSGDSYSFEASGSFYPGNASDLNDKNLTYDETLKNGLSTKMVNFWYSASDANAPYESRKVYNSKITFRPTDETNAKNISDARYEIAHFDIQTNIYGYDAEAGRKNGEELFYDSMSVQTFGANGMRESLKFRLGKTVNQGDVIRLEDLYREKVSTDTDFSTVQYKGYAISGDIIDFSQEITVNKAFTFTSDCAIVFTSADDDGITQTAIVEIVQKSTPDYRITDENHAWKWSDEDAAYVSDTIDKEGSSVELPSLTYSWTGVKNVRFRSNWYDDEVCINPLHVGIFTNQNGVYSLTYIGHQKKDFTASAYETYVCYELVNGYGETEFVRFKYVTSKKETYRIESVGGEIMDEGDVQYDEYGKIKDVRASESVYLMKENCDEKLSRLFRMTIGEASPAQMSLTGFSACLVDKNNHRTTISRVVENGDMDSVISEIKGYMEKYSWFTVSLEFSYFGNQFNSNYLYGVTFSGETTTDMLKYNSYFANTLYTMSIPRLYSSEGNEIATTHISVKHRIGGKTDNSFYAGRTYTLRKGEYEYSLKFNEAGEFYVGFGFAINGVSYSFGQVVNVLSDTCDVAITFVTDPDHPFSDGLLERTVTYNLSNNITALNEKEFAGNDILFGWTQYMGRDATSKDVVRNGISDFIGKYNSQNVTLYAIWDSGISVTAKSEGNDDRIKHYFRDSTSGYYVIDLSVYQAYAPAGYVLAGWSGGFLGDAVKNGKIYLNEISDDCNYFTIHAVYKKLLTVKYSIHTAYSASVIRNDSVIEGNGLESNRTVVAKTGYTFKGWFVQGDEGRTVIDLSTYKFTEDTVLVAVFTDSEGNEVW